MANEKELNPSPKFPVGEKPELSPNPNFSDGLENKTSEKANTQIVNESKVQPIKNLTVQQIIELIQKYAPKGDTLPSVTSADNEKVLEVLNGAWGTGRKKVNVMNAPSSTTLTDEQVTQIIHGCFINGISLGYHNPVFFPAVNSQEGVMAGEGNVAAGLDFRNYTIDSSTKVISLRPTSTGVLSINKIQGVLLDGKVEIKGKQLPSYSADTAVGQFICRKGRLEWYVPVAQDNITSGDTIALDSSLGKALIDHLEVEINGFRARYEYTSGNYVVYSSKTEADNGTKLQVNMIKYNTTTGELVFNSMTFTPNN